MFLPGVPLADGNPSSPTSIAGEGAKPAAQGDGEFARLAAMPVTEKAAGPSPQIRKQMPEASVVGFEMSILAIADESGKRAIDIGQLLAEAGGTTVEAAVVVVDPAAAAEATPAKVTEGIATPDIGLVDGPGAGVDKLAPPTGQVIAKADGAPVTKGPITEQQVKTLPVPQVSGDQTGDRRAVAVNGASPPDTADQVRNAAPVAPLANGPVQTPEAEPGQGVRLADRAKALQSEDARARNERPVETAQQPRKPDGPTPVEITPTTARVGNAGYDGEPVTTRPNPLGAAPGRGDAIPEKGFDLPLAQGRVTSGELPRDAQDTVRTAPPTTAQGQGKAEPPRPDLVGLVKQGPTPAALSPQEPPAVMPTNVQPAPAQPATGMAMAMQAVAVRSDVAKQDPAKLDPAKDGAVHLSRDAEPEGARTERVGETVQQSAKPALPAAKTADIQPATLPTPTALPPTETMLLADGVTEVTHEGFSADARSIDGSARAEAANAPNRAQDLPRPAMNQILDAMRTARGSIDLTLSPEELGRVTLALQTQDGVLNVVVTAERPETADLIRRSLDLLLQEAKSQGFDDVSFGFAGGDASGQSSEGSDERTDRPTPPPIFETVEPIRPGQSRLAAGGLDLRM